MQSNTKPSHLEHILRHAVQCSIVQRLSPRLQIYFSSYDGSCTQLQGCEGLDAGACAIVQHPLAPEEAHLPQRTQHCQNCGGGEFKACERIKEGIVSMSESGSCTQAMADGDRVCACQRGTRRLCRSHVTSEFSHASPQAEAYSPFDTLMHHLRIRKGQSMLKVCCLNSISAQWAAIILAWLKYMLGKADMHFSSHSAMITVWQGHTPWPKA